MLLRVLIAAGAILLSGTTYAFENVAHGKPVILIGEGFFVDYVQEVEADPQLVTDGWFLPLWTSWKGSVENQTIWWLDQPDKCRFNGVEPCAIEIDLQGQFRIFTMIFQGDSDQYLLEYWDDGLPGWQPGWLIPIHNGAIQTRPDLPWGEPPGYALDPPIVTNRLRITGVGPDYHYAVSEVQAFGEPMDPCIEGGGTPFGFGCWSGEPAVQGDVVAGSLCYRAELSCDGIVHGGFGGCFYPNGYFDMGIGGQLGDPPAPDDPPMGPDNPNCGIGGGYMLNDEVELSCSLDDQGKVKLKIKRIRMKFCNSLP